jgi:hypothetical protein
MEVERAYEAEDRIRNALGDGNHIVLTGGGELREAIDPTGELLDKPRIAHSVEGGVVNAVRSSFVGPECTACRPEYLLRSTHRTI